MLASLHNMNADISIHTVPNSTSYCMRIEMDQVPERDWVCEDCMLMQEPKRLKLTEVERSESTCNPSFLKGTTQGLPTIHSSVWHVDGLKTNHSSKRSCLSAKRPVPDVELKSAPKRRALGKGIQPLTSSHFGGKTLLTRASSMAKSNSRGAQVSSLANRSTVEVVESTSPLPCHKSHQPGSGRQIWPAPKNINPEKSSQPPKSPGSGVRSMLTRASSSKIMNKGKGACYQVACYQVSSSCVQSAKKEKEQEISLLGHRSPKPEQQSQAIKSASIPGGKSQLTRVSSLKIMDKGEGAHFHASSFSVQFAKKDKEQKRSPSGLRLPKPEPQVQELKPSSTPGRKSQLIRLSSLKIMDRGKRESSFGIWFANKEVKQGSPLPGSLSKSKPITNAESGVEVQRIHEVICSGSRTVIDSASHELKNCHGKKLWKSVSSVGDVCSVAAAVSNDCLDHASNAENLRHGNKRNSTEKRSAQLGLPIVDFDAMNGKPSEDKMVSEIIDRPQSSSNDVKHMISKQVNRNSDLKVLGSVACDGRCYENTLVPAPKRLTHLYLTAGESAQEADLRCSSREDDNQVPSSKVPPVDLHDMEKSLALTLADVASLGISAVPESECIWKGAFQLEEGGKLPNYCRGIQAHLSTSASSKVLELVPKFHPELMLKEVPRLDIWPVRFQKNCPTERDIALYFFAEDLLSHAGSYTVLLEGMIRDDLALEANFDGAYFLWDHNVNITFDFTLFSAEIPCHLSCNPLKPSVLLTGWNDLFFLWGVFRVRKVDNHSICISSMSAATLDQGLCTPVTWGALCASEAGSPSASPTSDNSIKRPESANTKARQSSSPTKFMDQSYEHDEVSSAKKCLGTQSCKDNCIAFANDYIEKSSADSTLLSNNFKMEVDPVGYGNLETRIFPFRCLGKDIILSVSDFFQEEKRLDVRRSSFSIESGQSGSSNGAGCAKSDEGQVDQFQDPSSWKTLNLDLSLRPMAEPDIDLDLVLGSPNTKKYEVKLFSDDRNSEHWNISPLLSLGLPCSNG
ncbi:hypothetical protein Cgig2_014979 [Carnegiea gigantea]|uniref:AIPP2-like SPOC-like domain-containing protein n=1 Tax=Carnegiea gigantea TaxID=171969 RepID=A0A9Q1Q8W6_9CARY|nr:hypothetical protein Cgig2_014979 [Carnegiea gigantea]